MFLLVFSPSKEIKSSWSRLDWRPSATITRMKIYGWTVSQRAWKTCAPGRKSKVMPDSFFPAVSCCPRQSACPMSTRKGKGK